MSKDETTTSYVIGMSPWNPYFKEAEIDHLLKEIVGKNSGPAVIMIADIPAIKTHEGRGYSYKESRTEATRQGNSIKNKVRESMVRLQFSDAQVKIIEWNNIETAPLEEKDRQADAIYQKEYDKVRNLYDQNPAFRASVRATTQKVLEGGRKQPDDMEKGVDTAVHYLLSEFAFLEFSALTNDRVSYVYHDKWPVYEDYIAGRFDGIRKSHLDFTLVQNPYEKYVPEPFLDRRPDWLRAMNKREVSHDGQPVGTTIISPYQDTLERIQATKTIRVASANYSFMSFIDKTKKYIGGTAIALLDKMAKRQG